MQSVDRQRSRSSVLGSECPSVESSELLSSEHDLPVLSIRDDRVSGANAAACRLFGRPTTGEKAEDLFTMSCRSKVRGFLSSGTPATAELVVDQCGTPLVVKFFSLASGSDKLLIAIDVTGGYSHAVGMKLMAANSDLANLTRELSLRIHELDVTRQILVRSNETEARLRRELQELEHLREEWSAIIAHDLRQPVSTIALAAAVVLASASVEGRERESMERIRSAAQRLGRMIEDLTTVSQVESKRMSVHAVEADVGALTAAFIEGLQETTESELRVAIRGATSAWVDPDRLPQMLGNLLSNAIKYGRPNTPIEVRVIEHDAFVEVCVENQGIGIQADQIPLLFHRFARTREARDSRIGGLGVGLYITKGLVEAHGGRIWVESTPGASTCFHFTVPKRFHGGTSRA